MTKIPLSFFVPEELRVRLVELAKTNDRSVSAELRIALRQHLGEPVSK